jgi:hypothetical protein
MNIMMVGSQGDICLRSAETVLRSRGSFGAVVSQMVGAEAQVTRGGPGATPGREAGARAVGARGGPGAASNREAGAGATGTRGSPEAVPSWEAGAIVLTLCLYAGYLVLRLPTVAPGPTPGEAENPWVGPTSFPRAALPSLYTLGFQSGGAARPIRGDP